MRRVLKSLFFVILFYVVPLAGAPSLILDPRIVLLAVVAFVVMVTQPELSMREIRAQAKADKYSTLMIMAAALISQVLPVLEWAYGSSQPRDVSWTAVGACMLLGGTAFRIWAIGTLGRFFTQTVMIQDDHRLIQAGPYRVMDHPSYFGAYIAVIGSGVLLHVVTSTVIAALVMGAAYRHRMALENQELDRRFGRVAPQQ